MRDEGFRLLIRAADYMPEYWFTAYVVWCYGDPRPFVMRKIPWTPEERRRIENRNTNENTG